MSKLSKMPTSVGSTLAFSAKAPGLKTNFSVVEDGANSCSLINKLSPIDQLEKITFKFQALPRLQTSLAVQNPYKVKSGVQYLVKTEEIVRTTDSTSPDYVYDQPIIITTVIRHGTNGDLTVDNIQEALARHIGSLYESSDNSTNVASSAFSRFNDLMRSALQPIKD